MRKLVLAPIALALLGACATQDKVTPAPAPVVVAPPPTVVVPPTASAGSAVVVPATPLSLRTGTATVDSITPISPSAAAGGTAGGNNKRIGVRMADNTLQFLDTAATGLSVGERVEITSDGYLRRPAP